MTDCNYCFKRINECDCDPISETIADSLERIANALEAISQKITDGGLS